MSKVKKDFSIVSINRVSGETYKLDGNKLFHFDLRKANNTKEFYITYIQNKDVMTTTIEINKSTPPEEMDDKIVVRTYEDLGLDAELDYKIIYSQSPNEASDTIYFNSFVLNSEAVANDYQSIVSSTGYIDYLASSPFLMQSLYQKNILVSDGCDCFIYMQRNDAFLAIYQNGEYFQSRPLRYNLKFIYDKFTELSGNRISEVDFFNMIKKDGINFENPAERDYIIQIFDDMFFYVGDIINSINKIYKTDIRNVYFGSDIGHINGVEIFIEDRLGLQFKSFEFNIAINSKDFPEITQLDMLMMLTAQVYLVSNDDDFNFSIFLRPPPLMQRQSGKFLRALFIGLILGLAYPLWQYGYGYFLKFQKDAKQEEYNIKHKDEVRIKNALAQLEKEILATNQEIAKEKEALEGKKVLLEEMHRKKVNYHMKSKTIFDITNLINDQEGKLHKIMDEREKVTFSIRMKSDKRMTELFKSISDSGVYSVNSKSIIDLEDGTQSYESNVTVEAK